MARKKKFQKKLLSFGPIFILVLILVILSAYHLAYFNRIYPGISLAGVNLSNKTKDEVRMAITSKIASESPPKITLVAPNQTWEMELEALGLSYKIEESLQKAYEIGRSRNPWRNWQDKKNAWFSGLNLPLEHEIDQNLLSEKFAEISDSIFIPAINPQIKVLEKRLASQGLRIQIEPGQDGQELDKQALSAIFASRIASLDYSLINLPIIKTSPALSQEEAEETRARAENFLDKKLSLVFEDEIFVLEEKQLIDFISPWNGFDQEKISKYVSELAFSFNRPPQNAAFQFSGGRVTVFRPAKEGTSLDESNTTEAILKALEKIEKEEEKEIVLTLQASKTLPQIKTEDVNNLGIRELLGKGVSYFRGSIASRVHNITLASSKLNGILVAPGETFSFNQILGEVSQTTGYKEAYVIKEGRTILGDGGGVCQVSTTLFRAVLNAGLPIEERHPHAYRVSYYEQGFSPGLDATVWEPTADLKFKNDTPAHILIQSSVNPKTYTLIFEIYGTSDGRIATIGKSRVWDQVPPPPDLYQDDPTLPAGTIKQVDWRAWGAKVALDWKVVRGGEVLQERTFYSNYRPWQAVFLRGTEPTQ